VLRRPLALAAVACLAGIGLAGCASPHDSTGRVTVSLSQDAAPGQRYLVKVKDFQGQTVEHERLSAGQTSEFAGVPLGKVTASVSGWCKVHGTLSTGEVLHFTLGPSGCSS
jgi:hypothetical protein